MLITLVLAYCLSNNFSTAYLNLLFFGFGLILKLRVSGIVEFYSIEVELNLVFFK